MTILVSSLAGGGSAKKISSVELGNTIATGTTGDVTISCPANKYINLTFLTSSGPGAQSGFSLTVGGRNVIVNKLIAAQNQIQPGGSFIKIGQTGSTADSQTNTQLTGGRNEDFVFNFGTATTQVVYYSYEVLEDA